MRDRRRLLGVLIVAACLVVLAASSLADGGGDEAEDAAGAAGTGDPVRGLAGTADTTSGEFSLLTYNVAGLPAEVSRLDPDTHLPLIGPLLNRYDVVLTQEDFDWWRSDGLATGLAFETYHERLRRDATHLFRSPAHPGPQPVGLSNERQAKVEFGDGLGFLSRYPIEGNARVPWPGCSGEANGTDGGAGDCMAMKGFAVTMLTLADGATVDLFNVHVEAGETAADQELQAADLDQLARFIEDYGKGRPVIVAGDTALHTDADEADRALWEAFLERAGLVDACAERNCDTPGRVDKVAFRSGEGVDLAVLAHEPHPKRFVDKEKEPLSDHVPLEVRMSWKRPGA